MFKYLTITFLISTISLSGLAYGLKAKIDTLKMGLAICKANSDKLQDALDLQNATIKTLEIDTQKYKDKLDSTNKQIDKNFNVILNGLECEQQLKEIDNYVKSLLD